ncbi:MAG: hypothetical protein RE471_06990 [Ferroplasma sp.]|uniref:hypothetical protein n=1 Tax=Ferroplasma sp. TaxID=2591003 RepID=UPI0028160B19|nr:hypothetical protein [Ferroplasma sp.]WMT50719.1 MAG: hypothetical protein RE471_06990 [Ferroplasma sp.]
MKKYFRIAIIVGSIILAIIIISPFILSPFKKPQDRFFKGNYKSSGKERVVFFSWDSGSLNLLSFTAVHFIEVVPTSIPR